MPTDFPSAVTTASGGSSGFGPDGYEVIEDAIGPEVIERLRAELAPHLQGRQMGRNAASTRASCSLPRSS